MSEKPLIPYCGKSCPQCSSFMAFSKGKTAPDIKAYGIDFWPLKVECPRCHHSFSINGPNDLELKVSEDDLETLWP